MGAIRLSTFSALLVEAQGNVFSFSSAKGAAEVVVGCSDNLDCEIRPNFAYFERDAEEVAAHSSLFARSEESLQKAIRT